MIEHKLDSVSDDLGIYQLTFLPLSPGIYYVAFKNNGEEIDGLNYNFFLLAKVDSVSEIQGDSVYGV